MKDIDAWMPLYIADYLADTSRLTTEQHGAYLLMLMDYWRSGPLPDDDEALAAITKLALPQWRKARATLCRYFSVTDGLWRHKRVEEEKARAEVKVSQRSEAGKKGAAARHGKTLANA